MAAAAGVYIHIPYCKQRCGYCSFVSSCDPSTQEAYAARVKAELAGIKSERIAADTLYIGGGTPSVLRRGLLSDLIAAVRAAFLLDADAEITAECNPESCTDDFLSEAKNAGVNRLSMGLQDADDTVLRGAGRLHSRADFVGAVGRARAAGLENLSVDLMLGLPGQTVTHVEASVKLLLSLDIPHISVYALKLEPDSALAKSYTPDEDLEADFYQCAAGLLTAAGRARYEVSNFARPGRESRHNLKYWTHTPYYGFGVAAHSFYHEMRYANPDSLTEYLSGASRRTETPLSPEELREETVMLRLRLAAGLELDAYEQKFGENLREKKAAEIRSLCALGMIEIKNGRLFATDRGMYLLNSLILRLI
ncbi:MAG: radical SAM family heme chaperone HemW [Clostridiales bacterium]|jgi:oxygen-independent coproporphyrinogen-3 oxidase|nr:radical SAM family heme chaperone HemW [Clostridiales bacterium]